jgi:hypothetical protein
MMTVKILKETERAIQIGVVVLTESKGWEQGLWLPKSMAAKNWFIQKKMDELKAEVDARYHGRAWLAGFAEAEEREFGQGGGLTIDDVCAGLREKLAA